MYTADAMASFVADADALRDEMALVLRSLSGDADEADATGCEAKVAAFLARAERLQSAFAIAAEREDAEDDGEDVASLRVECDALRRAIAEKDALLDAHRKNLQRWQAECDDVRRLQLVEPECSADAASAPV